MEKIKVKYVWGKKEELPPAKMVVDKFRIIRDANIMKKSINLGIGRKHIIM